MTTKPGLSCPRCQSTMLRTIDTRKINGTIRRKRECFHCGAQFYTTEAVQTDAHEVRAS